MHVATILPVPHLQLAKDDRYHLCLAQILAKNAPYRDFFAAQAQEGKFVILDNGAAEGGCQPIELILEQADDINATELVLPDVIYDTNKTLDLSWNALMYVSDRDCNRKIMVVPQGETFEEWCKCASEMIDWGIDTVGVSKFTTPKYGMNARLRCVKFLHDEMKEKGRKVSIHLLGCWKHPNEIGRIGRLYEVRGTDSAVACIFTKGNKSLLTVQKRPDVELDFIHDVLPEDALKANVAAWRKICGM